MALSFRDITRDNFLECIRLAVRDDQRFVASNVFSLAESRVDPACVPKAIYRDETMVGFIMYEIGRERGELHLSRLMIDQRYQHHGHGKGALDLLVEIAEGEPGIDTIALSTRPDNSYGIRFYERFGFRDTGELEDGEKAFVLHLPGKLSARGPRVG
jgi:diamine N-acetyltransferase